jgi:DNA-binding transcriptional LysR family regulator
MIGFAQSRDFLTALFAVGGLGCLTFVVLYAWRSRGWWRSDAGRNLMAVMTILLTLLGLVVAGRWFGPLPRWLWSIGLVTLDIAIWWRVIILWRKQHERITS